MQAIALSSDATKGNDTAQPVNIHAALAAIIRSDSSAALLDRSPSLDKPECGNSIP